MSSSLTSVMIWCLVWCQYLGSNCNAEAPCTAAAVTPDHGRVIVCSQHQAMIAEWPGLKPIERIPTQIDHIHDVAFSNEGNQLLVAGGTPGERGLIERWSWPNRRLLQTITAHDDTVMKVAWNNDSRSWMTASMDGHCHVYSTESNEPIGRYTGHSQPVLAIVHWQGAGWISAGQDYTVQLFQFGSSEVANSERAKESSRFAQRVRSLDNHTSAVLGLAVYRPANRPAMLATVSHDKTVRLWQPDIGRLVKFARLPTVPRTVCWDDDGLHLWVGCDDGQLRSIDASNMQVRQTIASNVDRIYELVPAPKRDSWLVGGERGATRVVRPIEPVKLP